MPESDFRHIRKITRLTLSGFRGWARRQQLPTDADIVLVVGPNGYGKSSMAEALALGLAGAGHPRRGPEQNEALDRKESVEIRLEFRRGDGVEGEMQATGQEHEARRRGSERSSRGETPHPNLVRRVTAFFQDQLLDQFRCENATLLGFLSQPPPELEVYLAALREVIQNDEQRRPPEHGANVDAEARGAETAFLELEGLLPPDARARATSDTGWKRRLQLMLDSESEAQSGASPGELLRAVANFRSRLKEGRERPDGPEKAVGRWAVEVAEARRRQAVLSRRLEEHRAKYPRLHGPTHSGVLPDLEEVERILRLMADARNLRRFLGALETSDLGAGVSLEPLGQELRRVDPGRAAQMLDPLRRHVDRVRVALKRESELVVESERVRARIAELQALEHGAAGVEAAFAELEARLHRWEAEARREADRAERLRSWSLRQPIRDAIKAEEGYWRNYLEAEIQDGARNTMEKTANGLMAHFRHGISTEAASGMRSIVVKAHPGGDSFELLPEYGDRRELEAHFSTGQTAQMALIWMLAQNRLLERWLTHRVLVIDDPTSALDLTNCAAEALLLRQIAYGTTGEEVGGDGVGAEFRRQIFLFSHHDELTHRLVDALTPPEGGSMIYLHLKNWSREDGPTVEMFRMKATGAATDETRTKLMAELERTFGKADRRERIS